MQVLEIQTQHREEFIDITGRVRRAAAAEGISRGLCHLFVPHTTCALLINEHADPDVAEDILAFLGRIVPETGYRHREGNSPAHIKSSLLNTDLRILIEKGNLQMGTWQGVFFCEFDGPRTRSLWIDFHSF